MKQTISEEYRALLQEYGRAPNAPFPSSDGKWAEAVRGMAKKYSTKRILNYGAGAGVFTKAISRMNVDVVEYDPAVNGKKKKPKEQFDFVVCLDVLEHIEEKYIEAVLDELKWYIKKAGFFTICLKPAVKHTLPDGRNAHILLKSKEWWFVELTKRWAVREHEGRGWLEREFCVVVENKK